MPANLQEMPAFLLLPALLALLPQDPGPATDLQRLSERVDAVHYPDGRPKRLESFRADLSIEEAAADASQRGQAELRSMFREWQPEGAKVSRPLIRYSVVDAGQPIERGCDRDGWWELFQGEPRDLTARDLAESLKAAQRDTKLARQLLRFMDPGAVLRTLQDAGAVVEETLQVGRTEPVPCQVATGRLAAFPLLEQEGDAVPVAARIFVHRDTGRLVAIEARPLDAEGKPDAGRGEFLRFEEHEKQGPALLPRMLVHYRLDANGKRMLQRKVRLVQITLGAELRVEDFDRPRRKPS
ncbi:MAG: hypothetical protein RIT25_2064 [Planctomycetota bacterium]